MTTEEDLETTEETVDSSAEERSRGIDLEEECELAADYLEELLDIADLDGDIDLAIENGRAFVSVIADEGDDSALGRLVGADGKVLDALQELTRLAVTSTTGNRSRLMLDIDNHRKRLRNDLTIKANKAVEQVRAEGKEVALEPMNAFERKAVHDAVAAAGLESRSEGEDPYRYIIIFES